MKLPTDIDECDYRSMDDYELSFHHFGLVSAHPDHTKQFLQTLGYSIGEVVFDQLQGVNLIWCTHKQMPNIEIIFEAETNSVISNLLKKYENVIYHVCFASKSLESTLGRLKGAANRPICLSPPKPAALFGGKNVSFYNIKGFGLIEIVEI
jgi:methylmalonyl-CoA/ethylmalonyl-CoA epimerase